MKDVRDLCLEQLGELREFSTNLVEETLNDVRTLAKETILAQELVEISCLIYLVGTG
jgi:hypothetical protein